MAKFSNIISDQKCWHLWVGTLETNLQGYVDFFQSTLQEVSQVALVVKNPLPTQVRNPGSVPELGRSPGGGDGNPLQSSGLENPMDRT